MAIKLIGTDVPNVTATPQPQLASPVLPEQDKTALQITSQGLQNTTEVMQRSTASMSELAAQIPKGTQQALGAAYEYENRVIQQKANSNGRGALSGGNNLADTVVRFMEADQRRQQAEEEAKAKAAKAAQEDEFFRLAATVDNFTSEIQTGLRTNPGGLAEYERQFKQLVNDNSSLSTEGRAKLYSQFYGSVSQIQAEQGRKLVENREKYDAQYRESVKQDARTSTMNNVLALRNSRSNETRQANMNTLNEFFARTLADERLSDFDRISIVADLKTLANEALKESTEDQYEVINLANNYNDFIKQSNAARTQFRAGELTQADYEARIGMYAQQYKIPDNVSRIFGATYDLEESNEKMRLLSESQKLTEEGEKAAQDAVPFTDLLLGSLVAQARANKNSAIIANLAPGSENRKRVEGVIQDYNELTTLRSEVNQQNLLLRGVSLDNREAYIKAIMGRIDNNPSVNKDMLVRMGIDIKNASLMEAFISGKADPQQKLEFAAELRANADMQLEVLRQRQTGNMEKLRQLESRLKPFGLDQGVDKFPFSRFEAEQKIHNQRVQQAAQERKDKAIRLNPNASPNGQSNLFFKIPQLAAVQAGRQGQTFAPFKPGTQFSKTSEYKEQRGTHQHAGIDYAAAEGTPIIAHIPMKVVTIEYDASGYGHYVTTQGADGKFYRYGHLPARPSLRVGQTVESGQAFAKVGNSGKSSGAHVHFEVLNRNTYGTADTLDPIEYMKQFKANGSARMPRGQNMEAFYSSGSANTATTAKRASIPKNAVPLRGGLFIYQGQVYDKETLLRRQETRYSPSQPIRQTNNPNNKAAYAKSNDLDSNHGYGILAQDSSFRRELNATAKRLGIPPVWLADVIADETGATFSASIGNNKGHYGLIQFDEGAARGVGTTTAALRGMSNTQQLKYVEAYIRQRTNNGKWITSPHDLKAAIWYGNSSPESMRKLWNNSNINDGQISWRDFANRLGSYAGRRYDSPLTRRERLQSRLKNDTSALVASESTNFYQEVTSS